MSIVTAAILETQGDGHGAIAVLNLLALPLYLRDLIFLGHLDPDSPVGGNPTGDVVIVAGLLDPAGVRRQHPCQHLEQRGLTSSIAAQHTNRLAASETQTDAVEQRTRAVAHGDAFGVDQVAH